MKVNMHQIALFSQENTFS